jgi:hypothetical protein
VSSAPGIDFSQIAAEEYDAARRMRDAVNGFVERARKEREDGARPPFIAINLEDGRCPDGTLYGSRPEAVAGQKGNKYRFYVKIGPDHMGEREALVCLIYARRAFRTGHVFAEEDPVVPQRLELAQPFIPRTVRALGGTFRRG